MTYSIEALSESNRHQWEDFNNQSREGTLFHSIKWKKILEDVFKLKCQYYLIRGDKEVVGICPFVEHSAGPFRGLNGIPNSEFNNMLFNDSFNADRFSDLLTLFSKDYSYLIFSTYHPPVMERIGYDNFPDEESGNMVSDLRKYPPDVIWNDILTKNERNKIRKFEKNGFHVHEINQRHDIENFYHYYEENLKYIHGEILPFSFFQKLIDEYQKNELRIAVLTNGKIFVGGTLTFLYPAKKTTYFDYLSLNRNIPNRYTPTYYLFWDLVTWAWNNGYEKVSFGRQKLDPNNPRFMNKVKFGAEHVPIHSRIAFFSKTTSLLYRLKKTARAFNMRVSTLIRGSSTH